MLSHCGVSGQLRGFHKAQEEIRQLLEDEDFYCCRALASLQELSDELHREMRSSWEEIIALADTLSVGLYAVLMLKHSIFTAKVRTLVSFLAVLSLDSLDSAYFTLCHNGEA